MTTLEFKERFSLRYNNALEGAPGLDDYEISSYLTIAQEEIVKEYYDIDKNPTSSFELKERARRVLNELVVDEKITSSISSSRGLVDESRLFELSKEPMFIVLETLIIKSTNPVYNGKLVKVVPTTHDEFLTSYKNPFRKPNYNKAWRVDLSRENSKSVVEIIMIENFTSYNVRYISYPSPIILTNLLTDAEFEGLNLTIDGKTDIASCKLNKLTHSEIINRAVELAALDYNKGTDLQGRISMNQRV
jgi:hypothetical protein